MAIEGAIIGVDEVGRGCLAGPVYAAAVMFRSRKVLKFIDDSKLLSEPERRRLAPLIHSHHYVGIGIASVAEIEEYNILQASFIAMRRAIQTVRLVSGVEPEHVLVDGHRPIPGIDIPQTTVVAGDSTVKVIAAASVVAKVARDRFMEDVACRYPGYGFEKHKGYASPEHRRCIARLGPCALHRKTFHGVKEWLVEGPSL